MGQFRRRWSLDDSPQKKTDVSSVLLRVTDELEGHGPERSYANESEHPVLRAVDCVKLDVVRLYRGGIDGVILQSVWSNEIISLENAP